MSAPNPNPSPDAPKSAPKASRGSRFSPRPIWRTISRFKFPLPGSMKTKRKEEEEEEEEATETRNDSMFSHAAWQIMEMLMEEEKAKKNQSPPLSTPATPTTPTTSTTVEVDDERAKKVESNLRKASFDSTCLASRESQPGSSVVPKSSAPVSPADSTSFGPTERYEDGDSGSHSTGRSSKKSSALPTANPPLEQCVREAQFRTQKAENDSDSFYRTRSQRTRFQNVDYKAKKVERRAKSLAEKDRILREGDGSNFDETLRRRSTGDRQEEMRRRLLEENSEWVEVAASRYVSMAEFVHGKRVVKEASYDVFVDEKEKGFLGDKPL